METTIWEAWIDERDPLAFLRTVDQQVQTGKYASRAEAFLDFAEHALRTLYPEDNEDWTRESLAEALLSYAEACETGPAI